ncbi:MAG: GWxTD domain-containing protein, partial [bacterium]
MRQSISKMKIVMFLIFAVYFFIHQNGISVVEAQGEEHTAGASSFAFNAGVDTLMTEREYYSRLQAADEETFKQDFENYFLFLLNAEQKKAYEGLHSLGEKKAVIQYYWTDYNPNPLFPENDWLLEFNRRVLYAKKHYRRKSPPYVDDRGKYYIKYGEPFGRFVDAGGLVSLVNYDDDFRIRSRHATPPDLSSNDDPVKKYGGGGQKKKSTSIRNKDDRFSIPYWTLPNETWSYENIQPNFVVYFVRDGASYRQVRSIYDAVTDRHAVRNAIGATDSNLEYFIWRDMIGKRDHISPALARAVLPMRV